MQVSIKFDPTVDSMSSVHAAVANAYGNSAHVIDTCCNAAIGEIKAVTVLQPATPTGTSESEAGDTPTTATHDKTGLPWDARIHSTPATLTSKEVWRKRKGVDDITVATVEAELRGGAAQQAPATPPAMQMPPAPPAIQMPPAAPAAPSTYQQLVELIGANMHSAANPSGRITEDWVRQALQNNFGVTNGDLPNVANMAPETQMQILNGFKQALGIPV